MKRFCIFFLSVAALFAETSSSITDRNSEYKRLCMYAAGSDTVFSVFKRESVYQDAVELSNYNLGYLFARKITSQHRDLLEHRFVFKKNDTYGAPITYDFPELGTFSPATLRYVTVAADILQYFDFPTPPKIVEIGVGYGGQCFILSALLPFEQYTMIDLPVVLPLAKKYLSLLNVKDVEFVPPSNIPHEEKYDLFISNYAYSECTREIQLQYFQQVIRHCKRGYVLFNHISHLFNISSLSLEEFVNLLKGCGFFVTVFPEEISTGKDNYLVLWDSDH